METRHSKRIKQLTLSRNNSINKPEKKTIVNEQNSTTDKKSEKDVNRLRRPTTTRTVTYVEDGKDCTFSSQSSSSSSPSDSEDGADPSYMAESSSKKAIKRPITCVEQNTASSKIKKCYKRSASFSSVESYTSSSDDGEDLNSVASKKVRRSTVWPKHLKKNRDVVDIGDTNWPKCRKSSVARKTGNPSGSKTVKSGLRVVPKPKPQQPWKKNLVGYEAERKLAKGERRMKEYRLVAEAYSRGKIAEVSYDECFKAYHEGRKIIEAVEKREHKEGTVVGHLGENDSSSEDEWEDIEHFQPKIDGNIEVDLEGEDDGLEKDWWVVYLRQEVNKRIREMWENTHKVHILCFLAHLKFVVKACMDEFLVPSILISQLPCGYLEYVGKDIPVDVMQKLVKWFVDTFRPINRCVDLSLIVNNVIEETTRFPATRRLLALLELKSFETDLDRATLLFSLLSAMKLTARICVNAKTIKRKWEQQQRPGSSSSPPSSIKQKPTSKLLKKKRVEGKISCEERNYWVEYWCSCKKQWICIDPLHASVDVPLTIHKHTSQPVSYVFAIDNDLGICEVTQRYAIDYVKQEFRRRRTETKWIHETLCLPMFAADRQKKQWEKMQMHEELVRRPLPVTISEFKNHPLYALEKDLLKFEAIYPPPDQQKPLGQIRGHNVYPRSTVFNLQGENNWLKLARSVKIGEIPYKLVKARPNFKVPVEDRTDQFLEVFGYWQTEPYRRPSLEKGQIPRNKYGNVYMFNENMCPLQCVHLKLAGLMQIARKLNKQCVPAVVGWAFDGGWTHPVIDGAIVLEKDADSFTKSWLKTEAGRADKEEKKRAIRIQENWRKLIKGILRASKIKKQFQPTNYCKHIQKNFSKNIVDQSGNVSKNVDVSTNVDNNEFTNTLEGFTLEDFVKKT